MQLLFGHAHFSSLNVWSNCKPHVFCILAGTKDHALGCSRCSPVLRIIVYCMTAESIVNVVILRHSDHFCITIVENFWWRTSTCKLVCWVPQHRNRKRNYNPCATNSAPGPRPTPHTTD